MTAWAEDVASEPHVVVVGAGIAGLAAAYRLHEAAPACRVTVLEGSPSVGGKLALGEVGGLAVDVGAEQLLLRRPDALELVHAVGLGGEVVHPAATGAGVLARGRLRRLPPGQLMGIPTDLRGLAASGIVSLPGLARVPLDRLLPRTAVTDDVAIGRYVAARLGREVVDRLVEPLLGGVYAGHADELSLDAALPQLSGAVRVERSLLRGASQVLGSTSPSQARPVFGSVRGGLGRLPGAIVRAGGLRVRTSAMVRELRRTPDGWRLVVGSARDPEAVRADAVVLAVPGAPAARLLQPVAPEAALELGTIEYASVAVVTLALPLASLRGRLRGTGFLVPPVEGRTIKAATYASSKWSWLGEAGSAAGDPSRGGVAVVRASVGRHREVGDLQHSDDELVRLAVDDLVNILGTPLHPVDALVTRWGGGLPQYTVGHLERVARIRRSVAEHPGLAVCGAAYDGLGVPACVASARAAVDRVLLGLSARKEARHG